MMLVLLFRSRMGLAGVCLGLGLGLDLALALAGLALALRLNFIIGGHDC